MADELEHAQRQQESPVMDALTAGRGVPDILGDPKTLRLVPWGGDGDDPLAAENGDTA